MDSGEEAVTFSNDAPIGNGRGMQESNVLGTPGSTGTGTAATPSSGGPQQPSQLPPAPMITTPMGQAQSGVQQPGRLLRAMEQTCEGETKRK